MIRNTAVTRILHHNNNFSNRTNIYNKINENIRFSSWICTWSYCNAINCESNPLQIWIIPIKIHCINSSPHCCVNYSHKNLSFHVINIILWSFLEQRWQAKVPHTKCRDLHTKTVVDAFAYLNGKNIACNMFHSKKTAWTQRFSCNVSTWKNDRKKIYYFLVFSL